MPEGQALSLSRLIRAAGLRWPAEESFEFSKNCVGLDQSQARLYTAIARHTVLAMAARPSAPSLPRASAAAPTPQRHPDQDSRRPPTPG